MSPDEVRNAAASLAELVLKSNRSGQSDDCGEQHGQLGHKYCTVQGQKPREISCADFG